MHPQSDAKEARKDVIERVGSKSATGVFVRVLTAAILPTLISPAQLQALAEMTMPVPEVSTQDGAEDLQTAV